MNLSEKTLLRVIACTLAAGLAVPASVPSGVQNGAKTVYAEETPEDGNKTNESPNYKNGTEFVASAFDTVQAEIYINKSTGLYFKMGGVKYTQGITLGEYSYRNGGKASFNVENVDKVAFTVGCASQQMCSDDSLEVYADDNKIDTISLSDKMAPKEYTYDLTGVSKLTFSKPGNYAVYGLGNFKINEEVSAAPASTEIPTTEPTDAAPTAEPIPTVDPTIDPQPTELVPTAIPSTEPTNVAPTAIPIPTVDPTIDPLPTELVPTAIPTTEPTNVAPTAIPIPTVNPTIDPLPTELVPTAVPTTEPTNTVPTADPIPTVDPQPTDPIPTASPVPSPSQNPLTDLSGDGKISTADVRIIMKSLVDRIQLTEEQKKGADVDGNGRIDSTDALLYLRMVVENAANEK